MKSNVRTFLFKFSIAYINFDIFLMSFMTCMAKKVFEIPREVVETHEGSFLTRPAFRSLF
jgi:hypothetical protein